MKCRLSSLDWNPEPKLARKLEDEAGSGRAGEGASCSPAVPFVKIS